MLITHSSSKDTWKETSHNALSNYMRQRSIKEWENGVAGLRKFMFEFPNVNYRHFAIPSKSIGPGPTRLDFEGKFTDPMTELGKEDAKHDLEKPEGYNF